jgi:hypothetical protein
VKGKYFAKLTGSIANLEEYIRFEAADKEEACDFADEQAEDWYSSYEDPFDDEDCPLFCADVSEYNPEKHDSYFEHINNGDDWEITI